MNPTELRIKAPSTSPPENSSRPWRKRERRDGVIVRQADVRVRASSLRPVSSASESSQPAAGSMGATDQTAPSWDGVGSSRADPIAHRKGNFGPS